MKKFYCQGCGAEVPLKAEKCPKCEREFGSVLCPKCNYTGSSDEFYNGCPECGYLKKKNRVSVSYDSPVKKSSKLSLKLFILLFISLIGIIGYLIYIF